MRQLPLLILLAVICHAVTSQATAEQLPAAALSQEPLLRDLFSGEPEQLTRLTSCLDSVFKLKRAYEVLYSLKSIYSDFLSNRTDTLTEFEQRLLLFCQDAIPIGAAGSVSAYLQHPVNAHRFVAFTARAMNPRLRDLIGEHPGVKLLLGHLVSNAGCWLNEASVEESTQNLLTIKSFYNISIGDFARGNFSGRQAESGFSAQELMEFLLHLNRQFDPVQVAELAEYLRRERRDDMMALGEQPVRSLYRILGKAYYQMKQFELALEVLREYKADPAIASLASNSGDGSRGGVDADLHYIAANGRGKPSDFEAEAARSFSGLEREFDVMTEDARDFFRQYRGLCGDPDHGADANLSSANPLLTCEHWRPHNGWYAIRKEILTVAPMVVRYLDVFPGGENLTDSLMAEAEKRIYEAPPEDFGDFEKQNKLTKVRVHSFSKPLFTFNSNVTRAILDRIELVTRLDATVHFASTEKYIDVTNHGHGIRNLPHVTSNLPDRFYDGMATALFFPVEDVIGGELLFPEKHLKIPVKRSDLIVWYNYLPSYHADKTALHFSCPVVFGDKWTARVTLGLNRCSLDQELMMEPWLPGEAQARRRSAAQSWTVLRRRPKPQPTALNGTESVNGTAEINNGTAEINNGTAENITGTDGINGTVSDKADAANINVTAAEPEQTRLDQATEKLADYSEKTSAESLEDAIESADADEKGEADEAEAD